MSVDIGSGEHVRLRFDLMGDSCVFHNADERIAAEIERVGSDSLIIRMPVFGTYFTAKIHGSDSISGLYTDPGRKDYTIPFYAVQGTEQHSTTPWLNHIYAVRFSPDSASAYPAVGIFSRDEEGWATGTFLTETGDYRYLEGRWMNDVLTLSGFDGSHLFYFTAQGYPQDSLFGQFYSGKHWTEPWIAYPDSGAELAHPDSITQLTTAADRWAFTVYNDQLQPITFNPDSFKSKVTLVQLFGSWCPNCMDESRFLKEIYEANAGRGLEIIPVAFERGDDPERWRHAAAKFTRELDLPFNYYLGGNAGKGRAKEVFNMLTSVSSYPTTLFIDKSGAIRKIHTGFYGPGTGSYYDSFRTETIAFIDTLLNEQY